MHSFMSSTNGSSERSRGRLVSPRAASVYCVLLVLGFVAAAPAFAQLDWTDRTPSAHPPVDCGSALAYDSIRERTVLVAAAETWEWDGASWTERFPATSPGRRTNFALAYDRGHGRTVLFGGLSDAGVLL